MVRTLRQRKIIISDAWTQKLYIPLRIELEPAKKAKAFVKEVIVIDGPECLRAFLILQLGDCLKDIWSRELQTTNMSSTPIPIISIGRASCASEGGYPKIYPKRLPANTDRQIQINPTMVTNSLQCIGLNPPRKNIR